MKFLKLIFTIAIIIAAYFGDYVVFRSKYSSSQTFRAITDSAVHATLGFLSSLIFFSHEKSFIASHWAYNVIFCTLVSSLIDIDHAFVARSIYLKDMMNLKHRGIFHCTTFWLLVTLILLLYSYLKKEISLYLISFMLILAYTSHHLRDGNRRGLWMYPFGSSPPIERSLYMFLLAMLPHVIAICYHTFKGGFTKSFVVDYALVV